MTTHDLAPAFLEILYTGASGSHRVQVPTLVPTLIPASDPPAYEFSTGGGIDVEDAAQAYGAALATLLSDFSHINSFTMYTKEVGEPPIPIQSGYLDIAGSAGAPLGGMQAQQLTFSFRTAAAGRFKSVVLDSIRQGIGTIRAFGSLSPAESNFVSFIVEDSEWIVGRDGSRPTTFLSVSWQRNNALEKRVKRFAI